MANVQTNEYQEAMTEPEMRRSVRISLLIIVLIIPVSFWMISSARAASTPPTLIGIYPKGNLFSNMWPGQENEGTAEIQAIDQWIQAEPGLEGKGVAIAATFVDLEVLNPQWVLPHELGVYDVGFDMQVGAWVNGYIPFLNMMTTRTNGTDIANGSTDDAIRAWAGAIRDWSNGGQLHTFIAPFPEMNGNWVPAWSDPAVYKKAFLRIQQIFIAEGVPESAVSWVFAPNFASVGRPPVDDYYPGNSAVDVFGFSAYNYGDCLSGYGWKVFEELYKPTLDDHNELAPGKPFFITQMGVVDDPRKDAWLIDTLTKLANYPRVRAVLYYHIEHSEPGLSCNPVDYRIYQPDDTHYTGFLDALQDSNFQYWAPTDSNWDTTAFAPRPAGIFEDVWPVHPFSDQVDPWYLGWVNSLYQSGLTAGCSLATLEIADLGYTHTYRNYCPEADVLRGEMAIFLLRGIEGTTYSPPSPSATPVFNDIDGNWAEAWIEQLKLYGITAGYPDGTFRPDNPITRAEIAVLLLKAKHYGDPVPYAPPSALGGIFTDIDEHWARNWIEALAEDGITSGYPDGTYGPENLALRAEMAVFLIRTFNLPVP